MALQLPVTQVGLEASIQQAMKNAGRTAQINLGTNARQINALAQPLGRITGQADEFTKSMEAANARVFAFGASVGIINSVSKAFGALVKNTIQVEKTLTDINTVLNASSKDLEQFGNRLFKVAKDTGQSFDTVAQGALELARQGLSTEETLRRINDALILSRLSGLDATQSVEGLTAAFNSFKSSGVTTSEILNKLVVVSQKFAVSERDLIEALKRSASVADQAGVSLDELIGIVTAVQERTARGGAVIGNAFKTIFARIQDKGALQDLQDLGIQVTDTAGRILPATTILQNLAKQFESLSQTQQTDLAKKLGGVYQLSNLLAAVKDLSSEQSKYSEAVRLSAGAADQAYKKNAALNETLAALINKVTVSAQQLGATLGAIGLTDSAKNLLGFFNGLLESIQQVLGEQSAMGDFVRGLAKGIGNLITGPGLALFAAVIAKLSKDLVQFGFASLKSFFGIGKAAKEIEMVEKAVGNALASNINLQKQLYALEGNRAAQIKLMTDAVVQQEAAMRRMTTTASTLAGPLYQQGVRSTGGQGLRVPPRAAGGYSPVAQEARDISRGVGGARSSDKPVVIPNFAFGGGKRGTMVAHTGEYIVPNYANGGSAIFNRNMVKSMGLPAGAKKIGAAGGFVPNFAVATAAAARDFYEKGQYTVTESGTYIFPDKTQRSKAQMDNVLSAGSRMAAKEESRELLDARGIAMLIPTIGYPPQTIGPIKGSFKSGKSSIKYQLSNLMVAGPQVPSAVDQAADPEDERLEKNIRQSIVSVSTKYANLLGPPATKITEDKVANLLEKNKGAKGAINGAVGAGFEAATMAAIKTSNFTQEKINELTTKGGDFDVRGATDDVNTLFGLNGIRIMDFKSGISDNNIESMAKKIYNEKRVQMTAGKIGGAARGYVPNFANPRINPVQIAKGLGTALVKVLIDQYLGDGVLDSLEASGLMQMKASDAKAFATMLANPNKSKHRRAFEKALLSDPNMQRQFPEYYRRLTSSTSGAAGGFMPNFADPLSAAISREMSAGVPASKIYVDQSASLRSAANPMGLMVANRRDEPVSGSQGINRAIREGRNPKTYGAANGFVPNYAWGISGGTPKGVGITAPTAGGGGDGEKPARDMLGTIFAVQAGLSLLTGATSDATSGLAKWTNAISSSLGNITTAVFAMQGLKSLVPETHKFAGAIGKAGMIGTALVAGYEGFKLVNQAIRDVTGANKLAAQSTAMFTDAVNAAGISLGSLSNVEQVSRISQAKDTIYNIQGKMPGFVGSEAMQKQMAEFSLLSGITDEKKIEQILSEGGALQNKGISIATGPSGTGYTNLNYKSLNEDLAPKVLANYLKSEESQKNILKLKEEQRKKEEEKQKIEQETALIAQTSLKSAQQSLSSAIDLAVARNRGLDGLDKQKMAAEALNNLSQKELILLDQKIEKRDFERSFADKTKNLIQDQIGQLNGIQAVDKIRLQLQDRLSKLSDTELNNKDAIKDILSKITNELSANEKLTEEQQKQLDQIITNLFSQRDLDKDNLELKQAQERSLNNQKTTLQDIIALSERAASSQNFSTVFQSRGRVGQIEAQQRAIDLRLAGGNLTQNQQKSLQAEKAALNIQKTREEFIQAEADALKSVQEEVTKFQGLEDKIPKSFDEAINLLVNKGTNADEEEARLRLVQKIEEEYQTRQQSNEMSLAAAEADYQLANATEIATSAMTQFANAFSDQALLQKIQDLEFEKSGVIEGKRLAQIAYEQETINMQAGVSDPAERARIARERQVKGFGQLFQENFYTTELERTKELNETIVDASVQFKNNMIDGLVQAVEDGNKLSDILRSTALDFARSITKAAMNNLFNTGASMLFRASGGKVIGGSGVKDDVPAMLTGGEFVINKKSVQKYGPSFLTALNNGSIGGYAAGGMVKKDYFTPGTFGQGAIEGSSNLLGFATQAYTGGANDQIFGGGAAGISLEPESMRLTNFGRRFGPAAEATRAAKEQAFGLYAQEYQAAIERSQQKKAERKAFKRQMIAMAATLAIGMGAKAAQTGGLRNLFSGIKDFGKGNFKSGFEQIKLSQGMVPRAKPVSDLDLPEGLTSDSNPLDPRFFRGYVNPSSIKLNSTSDFARATGGSIPFTNGVDTVPSMLSGGEFIMNRSAAQNIGAGNLQALNAGASSLVTEETSQELNDRIIAKLDELIEATGSGAGNITINVDAATGAATQATEGAAGEQRQQLARQIKDVVLKVIQDEKRIGGQLRRGM